MTLCSSAVLTRQRDSMARFAAGSAQRGRATVSSIGAFAPLPDAITCAALLEDDPHDETLEIEITEDMVNLALDAVEGDQVWPYAADRGFVARPYREAQIIRFPGC